MSDDPGDEHRSPEPPHDSIWRPERSIERMGWYVNSLSLRYCGCPIYLVGGALEDADPRDIDIVCVLPDMLFVRAYGWPEGELQDWDCGGMYDDPPRIWRRWAADCAKQSLHLTACIGGPIVDFKTQPASHAAKYASRPRRRLSIQILKHEP